MWFLQIAQLSTTISQAHRATAFHFFTSKRGFDEPDESAAALAFLAGAEDPDGASVMVTSAMMLLELGFCGLGFCLMVRQRGREAVEGVSCGGGCRRGNSLR